MFLMLKKKTLFSGSINCSFILGIFYKLEQIEKKKTVERIKMLPGQLKSREL